MVTSLASRAMMHPARSTVLVPTFCSSNHSPAVSATAAGSHISSVNITDSLLPVPASVWPCATATSMPMRRVPDASATSVPSTLNR